MKDIKVSVIVPIYNTEKYLPRCLDSLVNQTLEEIEIVCVDDLSTDSSCEIVERYQREYPDKIRFYKLKEKRRQGGQEITELKKQWEHI